jgi:uncharacterized protein (TIGR03000 family)
MRWSILAFLLVFGFLVAEMSSEGCFRRRRSCVCTCPQAPANPQNDGWSDDDLELPPSPDTLPRIPRVPRFEKKVSAPAYITIHVPLNATVWFEGIKTTQTGKVRQYQSPSLEPGYDYQYSIRASWIENGQEVNETRQLNVAAGRVIAVDLSSSAQAIAMR